MTVYVQTPTVTLPYPGLRPFRRDEFEIFFGREEHVAALAEKLQSHHFVAVVGPSGCGKSSLVAAGLLPQLDSGHLVDIEGPWYEAIIRPGDHPFSRLAAALVESGVLPEDTDEDMASRLGFLDATLRRGPLGLIEALDGAEPLTDGNLLIVVDQFEEIFRFRHEKNDQQADALVALLLETVRQAEQRKLPVYVMLTMRSDYIGDCNHFSGLPEAISDSQFLTPRPNREQRHAAIVGPAAMFGGEVEPALVNRMLNDMGDDPDQLPIMQHALMRMWSLKALTKGNGDESVPAIGDEQPIVLTTEVYDEVGGWANTLSNHADEAFNGLVDPKLRHVAQMMFRCLTERGPDQHDVRRPVRLQEVAEVADVGTDVVKKVAAAFRRSDRSFVTPALADGDSTRSDLADDQILDISHESLIRQWGRLRGWAKEEAESATIYRRLEDAARRWKAGKEAYLQSPGLDIGLKWRDDEQPTAAWARRYGKDFDLSMQYLDESRDEKERRDAEAEAQRNELAAERARADEQTHTVARIRRYAVAIAIVSVLLAIALTVAGVSRSQALRAKEDADEQRIRAVKNLERFIEADEARKKKRETLIGTEADLILRQQEVEIALKEMITAQAEAILLMQQAELEKQRALKAQADAILEKQNVELARQRALEEQAQRILEQQRAEEARMEALEAQAETILVKQKAEEALRMALKAQAENSKQPGQDGEGVEEKQD